MEEKVKVYTDSEYKVRSWAQWDMNLASIES